MARKTDEADPFQGIPAVLYLDNGPVKSAVFKRVMESLGVAVTAHMPAGSDGRRTTARAKGKVERPFRTVKDAHETLYHFHQPASEEEANRWLARFIRTYNLGEHRSDTTAGSTTGGGICWRRACGRCARGIGSACLHASRSVASSTSTAG